MIIDNRQLSTSRSCSSSKLWSIDLRILIVRMVQQDLAMETGRPSHLRVLRRLPKEIFRNEVRNMTCALLTMQLSAAALSRQIPLSHQPFSALNATSALHTGLGVQSPLQSKMKWNFGVFHSHSCKYLELNPLSNRKLPGVLECGTHGVALRNALNATEPA